MKGDIFRLGSAVADGVGGPEAGAINLIYTILLQKAGLDVYSFIMINQIGNELNELIMKEGKKIHINIRYPVTPGYNQKTPSEKKNIQLGTAHAALLKIAEYDMKLDKNKLEEIRKEILDKNFNFYFGMGKEMICNKNKLLSAQMFVNPQMDCFEYYLQINEAGKEKCKVKIYCAGTDVFYIPMLFHKVKWKNTNEIIINGKEPHVETHVFADKCKAQFINLTKYEKSPVFEMMRMDISEENKKKAHENWLDSMPPESAALLRQQAKEADEYKKSRGIL
jgi:hypothetical protein